MHPIHLGLTLSHPTINEYLPITKIYKIYLIDKMLRWLSTYVTHDYNYLIYDGNYYHIIWYDGNYIIFDRL